MGLWFIKRLRGINGVAARIINDILNNIPVIQITRIIDNAVFPNAITFRCTVWLNGGISTIIRRGI
jgi:hypothetical protein